jgi:hypothetical protein
MNALRRLPNLQEAKSKAALLGVSGIKKKLLLKEAVL